MNMESISDKLALLTKKKIKKVESLTGGFQNHVFRFLMDHHWYIARLTPIKKRSKELIEAELSFMETLMKNNIQTPEVISINDVRVTELIINNKLFYITVFQFVEDQELDVSDLSIWNVNFFFEWGKTIGQMHRISETSLEKIHRPVWMEDDREVNPIPSLLVDNKHWLKEIYKDLLIKLAASPKTKHNFGLIHNDLHQGNFFVRSNQLILFDFDDCSYNWYVQDLSTSIYHALWTGGAYHPKWDKFHQEFLEFFLKGYLSVRELTENDLVQLELFLQMRELFLYLLFKKRWDYQHLEEWQSEKLLEMEENLRHNRIPYENELRTWKNETFNGHPS
jgi:amicoumacin kinase